MIFQKREFHVRWKGWGPEGDTMEPEDNLDCPELIEKFMDNWEKTKVTSEKQGLIAKSFLNGHVLPSYLRQQVYILQFSSS